MVTKPMSPFVRSYRKAVRLEVALMFIPTPTAAQLERADRAWDLVAQLHQLEQECRGPGLCEWCDRFPEDPS